MNANSIRPPQLTVPPSEKVLPELFLAGSIEMGAAVDWQSYVSDALTDTPITIFNPRRLDWDSSWVQSIDNPQFKEQVYWELNMLDRSNVIAMYFDPQTKSPITLLELGIYANAYNLIVCCPEGYWRKGNVDIVCEKHEIEQVNTLDELIASIKSKVRFGIKS